MPSSVPLYEAKADFFRTLAHPTRIRVLEILSDGPTVVRDLLAELGLEPSTLSQQMGVLRRAGLVTATREGSLVSYALSDPSVVDLLAAARVIITSRIRAEQALLADLEG